MSWIATIYDSHGGNGFLGSMTNALNSLTVNQGKTAKVATNYWQFGNQYNDAQIPFGLIVHNGRNEAPDANDLHGEWRQKTITFVPGDFRERAQDVQNLLNGGTDDHVTPKEAAYARVSLAWTGRWPYNTGAYIVFWQKER